MLSGRDVLIVEGEFLIALEIQRVLEGLGAHRHMFARSSEEALRLRDRWPQFQLAIVEVRYGDVDCTQLIAALQEIGVPTLLCSGNSALRRGIPGLPDAKILIKPVSEQDLTSAISMALVS